MHIVTAVHVASGVWCASPQRELPTGSHPLATTMCKRNWNKNDNAVGNEESQASGASISTPEGWKKDALSPYDDDINQVFDKVGRMTNHLADLTKKVVGHTYDFATSREFPAWKSGYGDLNNRPYQQRDEDLTMAFASPFDVLNVFGDASGRSPFGISSYGVPSTRQYNDCLRKDGLSLWDSRGYWRCLFPNREVPVHLLDYKTAHLGDQILTKDDFDAAPKTVDNNTYDLGPKGLFFSQYNDYLNWKNTAYEEARARRAQARERAKAERAAWVQKRAGLSETDNNAVVSSSVQSSMNTDSAKNETVLKEVRTEVFADGTSVTRNITKTKPIGAATWATVTEDTLEGKGGWFWN